MSKELERAKAADQQAWTDASVTSALNLKEHIATPYSVYVWSNAISHAYKVQWLAAERTVGWDWSEIARKFTPPKERVVAIRVGDRLSALAAIKAARTRVRVSFLEGDPREDCPLLGQRATIMLDLVATYGQRLGCEEICVEPMNDKLKSLYCSVYGFEEVWAKGKLEHLRRGLT